MYHSRRESGYTITLTGIFCVLYLAHKVLPAVGAYMPGIVYAAVFVLVAIVIKPIWISGSRIQAETISVFPLISIAVLDLINIYLLKSNIVGAVFFLYGELQSFLFTLIGLYYICYCSLFQRKMLLRVVLGMYIVTAITTAIGCTIYPNAARILATTSDTNSVWYLLYTKSNIGGFSFTYEIVLLTPIFIYLLKSKRINFLLGIACVSLIGWEAYCSEYTTALLLYLVCLSLLFIGKLNKSKFIIMVMIAIFLLTVGRDMLASGLMYLTGKIESQTVISRLDYLIASLNGTEYSNFSESGDRIALYLSSIDAFISSGFMGTWFKVQSGGHSYILDNIAIYGVVGIAAIWGQYKCIYNLYIRNQKMNDHYYYLLWMFFMAIILAIVNTKPFFIIFTVIIALLNSIIEDEKLEEYY